MMKVPYDRTNHSLVLAVLVHAIVVPEKIRHIQYSLQQTVACKFLQPAAWNLFSVVSPVAMHDVIVAYFR
jgi:hypothetical protein